MGLDIVLFREGKGGQPDLVRESQRRRYAEATSVDNVIAADDLWREQRQLVDKLKTDLNKLNKELGNKKKNKEPCDDLLAQQEQLKQSIKDAEVEVEVRLKKRDGLLNRIGNLVHESVPVSDNEDNNEVLKKWGEWGIPEGLKSDGEGVRVRPHHELLWMIGGYEPDRGVEVAGHRGYFLTDYGVQLNQALIQYGLQFLARRKYKLISTPHMMRKEVMSETAQLEEFDEALYAVAGDGNNDKYLIATSEQPISGYHRGQWIEPSDLPVKYGGVSTCYRKEAGASGRDCWGIYRVHQFDKIEQFCVTEPEKSWEVYDEMLATSEAFYQSLGLPYRLVAIVSGALNNAAAKKIDLEAWFPSYKECKELVSCSNCTDYQSRALESRCGVKKQGEATKKYVHMLNGTLCATTRTLCCILENYQTADGIVIPEVLRPFMYLEEGQTKIPFVRELKK